MAARSEPTTDASTLEASATTRVKTTQAELDAKMPASVKAFGKALTASAGRTFACPECGAASSGTCGECGYTHKSYRTSPSETR